MTEFRPEMTKQGEFVPFHHDREKIYDFLEISDRQCFSVKLVLLAFMFSALFAISVVVIYAQLSIR